MLHTVQNRQGMSCTLRWTITDKSGKKKRKKKRIDDKEWDQENDKMDTKDQTRFKKTM